ncbi:MAG: hypothetical protein Q8O66_02565 [bacterium]|nr:hypothetical protein [bacterium]
MKVIKQSTYETCLASCLLMMAGKIKKDEIEIWKRGWKFNYLIGQLNYVSKKYNKKIEAYVENKYYFNQLQKQRGKGIKLVNKKIDVQLLSSLLESGEVIIYLDCYYFQKILHAPHFMVALRQNKNFIEIIDPFDGKLKKISVSTIKKGINSLRNHLKYSPVLITFPLSQE